MSAIKIIPSKQATFHKARILIALPTNGGTGFTFDGIQGYDPATGNPVLTGSYVNGMIPVPEEETMLYQYRKAVLELIGRLGLHNDLEVCLLQFSNTANMTDTDRNIYGDDYRFVGNESRNSLVDMVQSVVSEGAYNLGDFYRRAYYALSSAPDVSCNTYLLNFIPSPPTMCCYADFEEWMPMEQEYVTKLAQGQGDIDKHTSRDISAAFDKTTGLYNWTYVQSFLANYGDVFRAMFQTANLGGSGSSIAAGVVDENSRRYAEFHAANLAGLDFTQFTMASAFAPAMIKDSLRDIFRITPADDGKRWFVISNGNGMSAAVNIIANAIIEDMIIKG